MTSRASRSRKKYEYDVVLSFAGEDRKHVNRVVKLLEKKGISYFYDEYKKYDLWGKDLYEHLDDVYTNKGRFCMMFLSEHYAKKLWTNHERKSAQTRAFEDNREYILPLRIDDTKIPGIRSTQGFLDLRKVSYDEVVAGVEYKLGRAATPTTAKQRTPRKPAIQKVNIDPKIPTHRIKKEFTQQEKDAFLGRAFTAIKRYFKTAINTYNAKDKDVTGEVSTVDAKQFTCAIYVRGAQRCYCKIWIGESYNSKGIYLSNNQSSLMHSNAYNHSLNVGDDGYEIYLQSHMRSIYGQSGQDKMTQKEAATYLWQALIDPLKH